MSQLLEAKVTLPPNKYLSEPVPPNMMAILIQTGYVHCIMWFMQGRTYLPPPPHFIQVDTPAGKEEIFIETNNSSRHKAQESLFRESRAGQMIQNWM